MKFLYNIDGSQNNIRKITVHSAATLLQNGAVVMKGVTSGTNFGMGVVGATTLADVIGVLEQQVLAATSDTDQAGTLESFAKVGINPFGVYLAEYSQASADLVTATSASSGTTFNCTSIEDITGGWIYLVSDANGGATLPGQLQVITAQGGGNTLTTKTALSPVTTATTKFIKILPVWEQLISVNTAATKLSSQAAAGSGVAVVLENFIQANNIPFTRLSAPAHSGLTGLDQQNVKFFAAIMFLDHVLNIGA